MIAYFDIFQQIRQDEGFTALREVWSFPYNNASWRGFTVDRA